MKTLTVFLALFTFIFPVSNLLRAQCALPTAQADLDIANVRAKILNGGDMWWDAIAQIGPKYEVPKNSGKHALFAGALWMGGIDASSNLCVAAQTYRQSGYDFWPGPLDTISATSSSSLQFNYIWKINKQDVINFIGGGPATSDMLTYPGNGTGTQAHFLAPFHDSNNDGLYNTADGDYPEFGFNMSANCCDILHGDQALWWVINDACSTHTASGGGVFGIEIQCQAYAYNTNDTDINNTTFYQYTLINRSSDQFHDFYFGFFADGQLGNFADNCIGSDVPRGLGYFYNGDADDEGPDGYGLKPPAVGIDFLQGPLMDNDSADNNRNCIIDEPGESIIMSKFVYVPTGPFSNYYDLLRGTGLMYANTGIPCSFMFPGNSDHQYEFNTGGTCTNPAPPQADWDEITSGNIPGARRFVASVGPFTLSPGAVHCITMAAIWARDTNSTFTPSVAALKTADDRIQMFFDSCFYPNILGIHPVENFISGIFPNPVNDVLEVRLTNIITEANFVIYNITGEIVRQVDIKRQQKFSVSCKDLSPGVYVYRIQLPDGKASVGKFIKE